MYKLRYVRTYVCTLHSFLYIGVLCRLPYSSSHGRSVTTGLQDDLSDSSEDEEEEEEQVEHKPVCKSLPILVHTRLLPTVNMSLHFEKT